jgi:hypothetical protein
MHAMPAIRPVNHLIDGRTIIIRSHLGSAITGHASADGAVVCYQADDIDPVRHTGWSAIIACDFLVVETVLLKRLHVLVFIEHGTRRLHLAGVTAHPTGAWADPVAACASPGGPPRGRAVTGVCTGRRRSLGTGPGRVRLGPPGCAHHDGHQPTQHGVVWSLPPPGDPEGPKSFIFRAASLQKFGLPNLLHVQDTPNARCSAVQGFRSAASARSSADEQDVDDRARGQQLLGDEGGGAPDSRVPAQ